MSDRGRPVLMAGAMATAFFLICCVQAEINKRWDLPGTGEGTLYLQSPALLQRVSLGYESLLADIYWIRAVQYYGRKLKPAQTPSYERLAPMLNLVVTLDPEMTTVYRFGAMFLSEAYPIGPGEPLKGIQLLDRAIQNNPGAWRFYFDKGFIYLWHLKDHTAAGRCFLEAGRQPGAPRWLESLAAYSLSEGGELETARYLWMHEFDEAESERVKENARNHLNSLQVDEDRWRLEFLIAKYRERTGRTLTDLKQLVTAGFLRFIPTDPSGVPYEYDRDVKGVYLGKGSTLIYFPLRSDARQAYWNQLEAEWQAGRFQTPGRSR